MTFREDIILIVSSDLQLRRFLKAGLENNFYRCLESESSALALADLEVRPPDLILIDVDLADGEGLSFISKAHALSTAPIIALVSGEKESDRLITLDQGAEDYVTKPFAMQEILARIRVSFRHLLQGSGIQEEVVFENGPLKIDFLSRRVFVDSREIKLTPTEYKLLTLLAKNPGQVIQQEMILKELWGPKYGEQGNQLRVHLHQIRHKIESDPSHPQWLVNEPGVGYCLKAKNS